jgi:DNA-directed RNA polymerase subunit A'
MDQQCVAYFTARTSEELREGVRVDLPLRKGKDFQGTVYDLRMGAFEYGQVCETCGERDLRCPGHFGYIELPEPCFNPCYGEVVADILQCVCYDCANPRLDLFPDETLTFAEYAAKAKNVGSCRLCENPLPKFTFKKARDKAKEPGVRSIGESYSKYKEPRSIPPSILMSYQKSAKDSIELTAKDVLIFFGKLSEDTLEKIGFNHNANFLLTVVSTTSKLNTHGKPSIYHFRPESLITEVLPVLPPTARPRVMVGAEKRSDDLTEAYNKIVKHAAKAKEILGSWSSDAEAKYKGLCDRIQLEYWKMTAAAPKNGKTSGVRAVKSLGDRLGGKEGRKTSNVAGKRSDMTSRTVGSPGGSLVPFGSLGYPEIFAKKLTQKEPVTKWNLEWANELLNRGKINIVERVGLGRIVVERVCKDGKPFEYDGRKGLIVGDLIHRQLMDGDPFFVGRQPSLRPESIQGVKAKLVNEITHMLPLANTRPMNADYDGRRLTVCY